MRFLFLFLFLLPSISLSQTYVQGPALIEGTVNTASAAGTTTLTVSSQTNQIITGSTTQTVKLPNATTLPVGRRFEIQNNSTGLITVQFNDATTAVLLLANTRSSLRLTANGTTNGTWSIFGPNSVDATIGTGNGLTISGQAISLSTSSTSTTGALTSTDWNTFNGKQASGNYITALTGGDVAATGPGSVAATVVTVGGSTAAAVNTATVLVNTAQSGNKLFASPSGGGSGAPAFRASVVADLPAALTWPASGTVQAITPAAHGVLISGSGATAAVTSAGTAGQVLTSGGASADPSFVAIPSDSRELINVGIKDSASAGALTVNLTQLDGSTAPSTGTAAAKGAFRNSAATNGGYVERSTTSALPFTLTSGTTLGFTTNAMFIYWYWIDSDGAGTMKLGGSTVRQDETTTKSTVAESFSTSCTQASPSVCTSSGHNMTANTMIQLTGTISGGLTTATNYYVVSPATNTFQLSATPGGTGINKTSGGTQTPVVHIADSTLVSDAAYTAAPIRLIAVGTYTLVTPGTWVAASRMRPGGNITPLNAIGFRAFATASTLSGSLGDVVFTTDSQDSTNSYNATTGVWVSPVSATCQFNVWTGQSATYTAGNALVLNILQNGSVISSQDTIAGSASVNTVAMGLSDSIQVAKGDYFKVQSSNAGLTPAFVSGNVRNFFSVQCYPQ